MHIEWKDTYRLGEERIDQQHQTLFALANAMLDATEQAAQRLCAMQLYRHVHGHFKDEERLMQQVGYPDYAAHVQAHNALLQRLSSLSQDIGNNRVDPAVVVDFMTNWGLHHIPQDDARLATYLQRRPQDAR
ncbi:MAG: bacteriohemerythrin [Rhodoferax sp.]